MGVTCRIEFKNSDNNDTYLAGQTVSGNVTLIFDKPEKVKAVTLKINGCADTRWSEDEGMGDDKTSVTYSAHVDYFKTKSYLIDLSTDTQGCTTTCDEMIIQPGVYCFPFACHIPPQCPSSIEGTYGYIRYWIEITLKRSWNLDNIFKRCFNVVNVTDFNYDEDLKLPVTNEISKIFCCGPCKSDPLTLNVQLPQTGFVPGQQIPISILATNETNGRINEIRLRLVMVINFFSTHPRNKCKEQEKTISKLIGGPVIRNCKKNFDYLLPIPATPPTSATLCSILTVTYRIEVEAKMGVMYTNQCIYIPVTICNVPLLTDAVVVVQQQPLPRQLNFEKETQIQNENVVVSKMENNNDLATRREIIAPWSAIGNMPAPVYMVASHMAQGKPSEDTINDFSENIFIPKYPVFNIPSPTDQQPANDDKKHAAASIKRDIDRNI